VNTPISICFVLPAPSYVPIGGYKVVYEYANRFAAGGFEVTILYPRLPPLVPGQERRSAARVCLLAAVYLVKNAVRYIVRKHLPNTWFPLDRRIRFRYVWSLEALNKRPGRWPAADVYVATALETSFYVAGIKAEAVIKKLYFIQGFENWNAGDAAVFRSYKLPLRKIVIAPWLGEKVAEAGETALYIPNGFDTARFHLDNPIESRSPYTVIMLYHVLEKKGLKYGFEALDMVKEKFPALKCVLFSAFPKPDNLPSWYRFYHLPDAETHNTLYNEAAIYVAPSLLEGFGLTPGEAMQCGCAVAATDNGGYAVTCIDGETALLCPPANAEALAANIITLIEDNALRQKIARAGNRFIQRFTWDASYAKFKEIVCDCSN